MTTQSALLCIICLIVFSYEEIAKKRWLSSAFFAVAALFSYGIQSEFWMDVTPLLFFFAVSRFIFYSIPATKPWPLNLGLASALIYVLIKFWHIPIPAGFSTFDLDLFSLAFLVFAILFSTIGLVVYFKFREFDISLIPIPPIQKKYVSGMIIIGSVVNSFREEIPYRWLLLLPLAAYTDPLTAVIIQGVIFGAMHFHEGLTNRWLGFLMTTIFGMAMGYATIKTGSIGLAVAVHAVVDMILLMIIVKKYIPETYFKAG